jgi:hypothetical protein
MIINGRYDVLGIHNSKRLVMIGWSGFCAKVREFVISKATSHAVTYWFDQKRSVARALVRLYETLQESSELLEHLLRVFDEAIEKKKPIAFSRDLVPFEGRITRLTQDVAAQYNNLIHAIHIFDPRLAELLKSVKSFKFTAAYIRLRKFRLLPFKTK